MLNDLREVINESRNNEEIFYTVTDAAMEKEIENGYEDLNELEKKSYMVGKYLQEVNNGGFDQYFYNTNGVYARETVDFLESINETSLSRILDEAISIWKAVIADDQKEEEFDKLDNKVYNLSSQDYDILYVKYVNYLQELVK
jgi:hypothetical protein